MKDMNLNRYLGVEASYEVLPFTAIVLWYRVIVVCWWESVVE